MPLLMPLLLSLKDSVPPSAAVRFGTGKWSLEMEPELFPWKKKPHSHNPSPQNPSHLQHPATKLSIKKHGNLESQNIIIQVGIQDAPRSPSPTVLWNHGINELHDGTGLRGRGLLGAMSSAVRKSGLCWELQEEFPGVSAPGAAVGLLGCGAEQSQSGQKGSPRLQHAIIQGCTHPWLRIPRDTCGMRGFLCSKPAANTACCCSE